ncbi:MAG TPA: helix-hairpin-helix domain-containing protein [Syntrophales bacterium]|nr:helix-hairpin-helix domain-containing protein [Syntrophales bacterium]
MPVHNADAAEIFNLAADLLEIQGANPFRVRAYRNAARTVDGLSKSIASMAEEGEELSNLPEIGEDLAGKIKEILKTGKLSQLENLKKDVSPDLQDVLGIPGLGPKKVQALHDALKINTLKDLEEAAQKDALPRLLTEKDILGDLHAHTLNDLENMRFSVWQARRGWREPDDEFNTRSWKDIKKLLRK